MRVLYLSTVIVVFDQMTKILVKGLSIPFPGLNIPGMGYGTSKQLFGSFVRITFVENQGIAFGWDVGPKILRIAFTLAAAAVIIYYIYKYRRINPLLRISLALILAGAIGNLIDRLFYGLIFNYSPLFYGKVVDFIQFDFWTFTLFGRTYTSWPVMNFADLSVTAGFVLMIIFHRKIFTSIDAKPITAVQEPGQVDSDGIRSSHLNGI